MKGAALSFRCIVFERDCEQRAELFKLLRGCGTEIQQDVECVAVASIREVEQVVSSVPVPFNAVVILPERIDSPNDGIDLAAELSDKYGAAILFTCQNASSKTLAKISKLGPLGVISFPIESNQASIIVKLALLRERSSQENFFSLRSTPSLNSSDQDLFRRLPPFDELAKSLRDELCLLSNRKVVASGAQLIGELEQEVPAFIPLSGRLAMKKIGANGKVLIAHYLVPGDVFQIILSLQDAPFPFLITVERESEILILPKQRLQTILFENPKLYESFTRVLQERLFRSEELSRAIAYDKVEERIAMVLSLLAGRIGS